MKKALLQITFRGPAALCMASALLIALLAGCSKDAGFSPQDPGVVLVPDSTAVRPGGQLTFKAVVTELSCDSLSWYVNGELGGDQVIGTITSDGVYTAPIIPPEELRITVKAVCAADTNYFAEAVVLIVISVPVELENYVQIPSDLGDPIQSVLCGAASGGRGVDGMDVPGDAIVCHLSVEHAGTYSAVLRAATTKGSRVEIRALIAEGDGDEAAEFEIVGKGFG